ncbi:MAG: polyprenyl synthetase family protein [Actinobacteria bacterium]|nr:polyprenyl synthetase family protein [Actinomycetota bacterium]MCG2803274.1 polyprenyl synthetase family protein [Cellulomonas sp.]
MSPTTTIPLTDPALARRLEERLAVVEERLRRAVSQADRLADDVSRHLVNAGGKRIRPLLTLLTAELGTQSPPEVVEAAVAVELTHLASLYHDDVMDSAPMRRGAPSAHEVWGNTVAILTGDLLFARASATVASLGPDAVLIHAETFERLCLGQLAETVGPAPQDDPTAHYLMVLADKTASLVGTSARYGAMFAGCSQDVVELVARFGERVGIAFQIADDYLDLASEGAVTGKTPGTDLREGVPTMPVLLLRAQVASGAGLPGDGELLALLDGDLSDDAVLDRAVAALRAHPVAEATRLRALELADEAVADLAPLPAGPAKEALVAFARALVVRAG